MKVISEKKVLLLEIEYSMKTGSGRQKVFDWLDEKYGQLKWRSRRSGPTSNGKGLVVAEVEIKQDA